MAALDICDSANNNNLWFVVLLLGLCGLNFVLLICLMGMIVYMSRGRKGDSGASSVQFKGIALDEERGKSSKEKSSADTGGSMNAELASIQRAIVGMERKLENKKINEITASYLLHNATDAIGNKVPTAAQVTLEQISAFQSRTSQKVEAIETKIGRLEDMMTK